MAAATAATALAMPRSSTFKYSSSSPMLPVVSITGGIYTGVAATWARRTIDPGVAFIVELGETLTPEEADRLRGLELFVPRDALPEPDDEDEFYLTDLVGLTAVDPAGTLLGKVLSVENYGAGDLIEVKPAGGGQTWLIEFTRENAPTVSLPEGRIVLVRPAETEATPDEA